MFQYLLISFRIIVLAAWFALLTSTSFSQIQQNLILANQPNELLSVIQDDEINLRGLRQITNFLTNHDVNEFVFFETIRTQIPKRKKAFVRHIKHISEKLEAVYFRNQKIDNSSLNLLYELVWFNYSFYGTIFENNKVTRKQQLDLFRDYKRSKKVFRYTKNRNEETVVTNSPIWHAYADSIKPYERFDLLAKNKKIKAKKNMVIVFDELSYSGSAPKVRALDLDYDNEWSLKWGDEVHTDVLGSRIFAALGFDVDHPYYYSQDKVTLVFDDTKTIKNFQDMRDSVLRVFNVDINPFVSSYGIVTQEMATEQIKLRPFVGLNFVRFVECGLEGRPDRVKRIGSFLPEGLNNWERPELRASLLAHAFIDNWDTREMNTLLTTVHDGNYNYHMSAIFSDLGTSLGVHVNKIPADFKVGLVNNLGWEVAIKKNDQVKLVYGMNAILKPYEEANYSDLFWMAKQIEKIDSLSLREMINEAGWPKPIEELYFHKMASRRASILNAFEIEDKHPIPFDRNLNYEKDGVLIIENGVLLNQYESDKHPESFTSKKGRLRNYGY